MWWLNGKSSYKLPSLQINFPGPLNPLAPTDMIAALGKNGQFINVVPSQNLVFIRMGNVPEANEVPITFNDTIWKRLNYAMCIPTAVKHNGTSSQLKVYPNPSQEYAQVELSAQRYDLEILDGTGRSVGHQKNCFDVTRIDTRNYVKGIYTIRITTPEDVVLYRKIVFLE